jgi:hypothetical protein
LYLRSNLKERHMGVQLAKFYEEAKTVGGMKAQMRLAVLTATPSSRAESISDSTEMVSRFQKALDQIKREA